MRKDPELAEPYKKDPEKERFLEQLNAALAPCEESAYRELAETYPTLHIVGAPRSGTTLLSQLVAFHLDVGYVNNLIAAFWRAPVHGIRLSKAVVPRDIPSSYRSDFGRTRGLHEPHEFGYFWFGILGYDDMRQRGCEFEQQIDWARIRKVLTNMTHAFQLAVMFKFTMLGWHIGKMQEVLPKTCFVRIRRDPTQNAVSLLRMRKEFLGSAHRWASMIPAEYEQLRDEPYWRQVAGQVYFLEKSMSSEIEKVNGRNVVEVDYEDMCGNPGAVLSSIQELLRDNGAPADWIADPPGSFMPSVRDVNSCEDYERIARAVSDFYDS